MSDRNEKRVDEEGSSRPPGELPQLPGLLPLACAAYLVLFLGAWGWIHLRGEALPLEGDWGWFKESGLGVGIGLAVAGISALLSRWVGPARALEGKFRALLGDLTMAEVLALAALSGIVEEVLFRAALQPKVGLVWASLLFGLMHVGPERVYLIWTFFAVAMGFLLGFLFDFTGGLAAPVALHFSVNLVNLARIAQSGAKGKGEAGRGSGDGPSRGVDGTGGMGPGERS